MKSSRGAGLDTSETKIVKELALHCAFDRPLTWMKDLLEGEDDDDDKSKGKLQDWRAVKDRTKTNHVLLLLCLNVGIDPPDVLRVEPCAKLECWTDPLLAQSKMLTKGSEVIGDALIEQYKAMHQMHKQAYFKPGYEFSVDDLKYHLQSMRKRAKDGRVLVHYNGHGVPRVTQFGELWFFDNDHTQYVPVTITEIMSLVGSPTIYILDCNNAGAILHHWYSHNFHQTRTKDILICACRRHEDLPQNPVLPADLLTSCLTTPIRASLEWYFNYSQRECLLTNVTKQMLQNVPGQMIERKTPLGELHWIFTAVTDAIAWSCLPRDLFNRLLRPRHDMLQVGLFRNFLLADRIMRETGCHPVTHPPLPETHTHPMWETWELALEGIISQLPKMLNADMTVNPNYTYRPSSFFSEQLTAFEIWVEFGCKSSPTPDQLPCIIQGLSSNQYRLRSLHLLARYLDLGAWAVSDALSCGVMPYVIRLLSAASPNYMVVIWTKILLVDSSDITLAELIKVSMPPAKKLLRVLNPRLDCLDPQGTPADAAAASQNAPPAADDAAKADAFPRMEGTTVEQCQAMACYIITVLVVGCKQDAQVPIWNWGILPSLVSCLKNDSALLKAWALQAIAALISGIPKAVQYCALVRELHTTSIQPLLSDPSQQVRAAACLALSRLIGLGESEVPTHAPPAPARGGHAGSPGSPSAPSPTAVHYSDLTVVRLLADAADDPSPLVREEVYHALLVFCSVYNIAPKTTGDAATKKSAWDVQQPDTASKLHLDNPTSNYSAHSGGQNAPLPVLTPPGGASRADANDTTRLGRLSHSNQVAASLDDETQDFAAMRPMGGGLAKKEAAAALDAADTEADEREATAKKVKDLRQRLVAFVSHLIAVLAKDPFPPLQKLVQQGVAELNAGKPVAATSTLFSWMTKQLSKPIFRVEGTVTTLERKKYRERLNCDTLQAYIARASDRSYLRSPAGPADGIASDKISSTPLTSSTEPIVASAFRVFHPQAILADRANNVTLVDTATKKVLSSVVHPAPVAHTFLLNDITDCPSVLVTDTTGAVSIYSNLVPSQASAPTKTTMRLDSSFTASLSPKKVCADYDACDNIFLYAADPGKFHIYSMREERVMQSVTAPARNTSITVLRHDDTGTRAIAAGFEDGSVRCWDARQNAFHLWASTQRTNPADPIVDVALRFSSCQLFYAHKSGAVKVWDFRAGRNDQNKMDGYKAKTCSFARLHHSHPILLCGHAGGGHAGRLDFLSTKNEKLGSVQLPKTSGDVLSVHPYQSSALVDRYLVQF
eukprot:TRINITY_DN17372_c3_g1_i1.p1 TRINITY_DN17372_c3_g1~~TRINITY_DN17372_c3_g1_i1.p1  ORF type:complete len:1289 (+),score=471.02 TRINITY_DN17372_c3_g1_i1:116-3982(+)